MSIWPGPLNTAPDGPRASELEVLKDLVKKQEALLKAALVREHQNISLATRALKAIAETPDPVMARQHARTLLPDFEAALALYKPLSV